MENRPLIGILVDSKKKRKKVLGLYERYHGNPVQLFIFTAPDILWNKQCIIGLYREGKRWKEKKFPFPMVVYNRSYNRENSSIRRIEKVIGKDRCFNKINRFNKWEIYHSIKQSSLKPYVPDTFLYNEVNIAELLEKYKLVYIKPQCGYKGKSVYRIEQMDHGDIYIALHSLAPRYICRKNESVQGKLDELFGRRKYIVQQGIRVSQFNHKYFDIRVLVQKGSLGKWMVSTITCRVAHENYFNMSMYEDMYRVEEVLPRLFSSGKWNEIRKSLYQLSVQAAHEAETHLGLMGELSVDFVLDEQTKLWIIELNGKPQKNIYKDLKGFKHNKLIYSQPMKYAYYLSQK
ncbi:hypothetical protein CR203_24605 [Salipaludibacillus neizhouensis]|uniref:ATP-grasp domain-containing protein n=1 Tax=Salipaludibacillus neizhouensis TaxID=885475 RepID=A0A3A9JW93_9BACI|nr:YheC/YheD family protein [Salipaludibacillus neizhouensis]RKL64747.1 hypothetical protein CR203_24605 [Salipaludibacillus neizhouensis]